MAFSNDRVLQNDAGGVQNRTIREYGSTFEKEKAGTLYVPAHSSIT